MLSNSDETVAKIESTSFSDSTLTSGGIGRDSMTQTEAQATSTNTNPIVSGSRGRQDGPKHLAQHLPHFVRRPVADTHQNG